MGLVIKKRRKCMAKKKHRKLLERTRIQRRRAGKRASPRPPEAMRANPAGVCA